MNKFINHPAIAKTISFTKRSLSMACRIAKSDYVQENLISLTLIGVSFMGLGIYCCCAQTTQTPQTPQEAPAVVQTVEIVETAEDAVHTTEVQTNTTCAVWGWLRAKSQSCTSSSAKTNTVQAVQNWKKVCDQCREAK